GGRAPMTVAARRRCPGHGRRWRGGRRGLRGGLTPGPFGGVVVAALPVAVEKVRVAVGAARVPVEGMEIPGELRCPPRGQVAADIARVGGAADARGVWGKCKQP